MQHPRAFSGKAQHLEDPWIHCWHQDTYWLWYFLPHCSSPFSRHISAARRPPHSLHELVSWITSLLLKLISPLLSYDYCQWCLSWSSRQFSFSNFYSKAAKLCASSKMLLYAFWRLSAIPSWKRKLMLMTRLLYEPHDNEAGGLFQLTISVSRYLWSYARCAQLCKSLSSNA